MAVAGRVLPLYKGPYDPTETYAQLDQVYYNGSTYACKQSSTGNLPTDTTYWQIVAQGTATTVAGAYHGACDSLGNVSNKTVTVSNADNFALKKGVIVGVAFTNTNTYSATAGNPVSLNVNNTGAYPIYFGGSSNPLGDSKIAFGEADYVNYYQFDGSNYVFIGRSGIQTSKETPLETPLTIDGVSKDNAEDALAALNTGKQPKALDTPLTIGGTSQTSVESALGALTDVKAERNDISNIQITGSTNTTGATIATGTIFYLNGELVRAKANIAAGATFTLNTNYYVYSLSPTVEATRASVEKISSTTSFDIQANSSATFTLSTSSSFLIAISGRSINTGSLFTTFTSGANSTYLNILFKGSEISASATNNTITISSTSSYVCHVIFIGFNNTNTNNSTSVTEIQS